MKVIYPDGETNTIETMAGKPKSISIFLAGTIDNGNAEDWQQNVINKLKEYDNEHPEYFVTVFNPRCKHWNKNADKEELASFMLSRDEAGNNYLWQALQDPETLVKAAWFILNGDEAFNNISDYFVNQIKLVSENQYKKGFEEGKNGKTPSRPQVVISNKQNKHHQYNSINDLDDDD